MGFWTQTGNGNVAHINGDIDMPEEILQALHRMIDLAAEMCKEKDDELPIARDRPIACSHEGYFEKGEPHCDECGY